MIDAILCIYFSFFQIIYTIDLSHIIASSSSFCRQSLKRLQIKILRSSFVYEIIVVYSLIAIRIAKIDIIVTMLVVANKFKDLNQECAINC